MAWIKLLGWMVAVALFGFALINLMFNIVEKFLQFAEAHLTAILFVGLLILVVVLSSI